MPRRPRRNETLKRKNDFAGPVEGWVRLFVCEMKHWKDCGDFQVGRLVAVGWGIAGSDSDFRAGLRAREDKGRKDGSDGGLDEEGALESVVDAESWRMPAMTRVKMSG
jgi:hypothetical protein